MAVNGSNWFTVTIQSSQVDADLTDYPVYVNLDDLAGAHGFWSNVKTDGADIRVTKSDGTTEVPFDLVSIDTGAETGELHFKASGTLSSTSNTEFRVYYNSSDTAYAVTATYGRNNVWTNYDAVWHLNASLPNTDSTGNGHDMSVTAGTLGTRSSVLGDSANDYNGSTYQTSSGNPANGLTDLTLQAWVNADTTSDGGICGTVRGSGDNEQLQMRYDAVDVLTYAIDGFPNQSTTSGAFPDGAWTMLHIQRNGSIENAYSNGSLDANSGDSIGSTALSTTNWFIGSGSKLEIDAGITEMRLAPSALSSDVISAEYNNQNSSSTFYTLSAEQSVAVADGYGLRAFWERENRFGVTDRIEIQEDGYSGSTVEFGAKSEPFNFSHREITQESSEGLLNIHANKILEGVLDFYPRVDSVAKQEILDDIANSVLTQYRVALKRDGDVMWYGYPSGRKVSRPETESYFATLRFRDVEFLKGQDFIKEDNRQTIITTIADLVGYLNFGIDITTVTSWQEENTTVTDDFLNQVYSDTYGLRNYNNDTAISVYEALERVAEPALLIKQWDGWRVNQISGYKDPTSCLESVYNSSGVQQSSSSVDKRQTLYTRESDGTPTVKISSIRDSYPAIKRAIFRHDNRIATDELGVSSTINTAFDQNATGTITFTEGSTSIGGSGTSFLSDVSSEDELWAYNGDYFEVVGIVNEIISDSSMNLVAGANFTASGENWVVNSEVNQTSSVDYTSTGNQSLSYEFSVEVNDVFGSNIDVVLPYSIKVGSYYYDVSTDSWTTTKTVNRYLFSNSASPYTVSFSESNIEPSPSGQNGLDLTLYTARRDSDDAIADSSDWEVVVFESANATASVGTIIQNSVTQSIDYEEVYNYGTIYYSDAFQPGELEFSSAYYRHGTANTNYTTGWRRRGETPYRDFERILLREIMDFQRSRTYKLRGQMWGEYDPNKIGVYEGFNFMHVGGSYNGRWQPIAIDVNEDAQTDAYTNKIVSTADTEASGGGTSGSGGTTSGISQADGDSRYLQQSNNLSDLNSTSTGRSNLGVEIGVDVQGYSAALATLSGNDGSNLTSLNATELTSGTVPSTRLTGSYTGITGIGALNAGSITSGFGNIDIGTNSLDSGDLSVDGFISVNGDDINPYVLRAITTETTLEADFYISFDTATSNDEARIGYLSSSSTSFFIESSNNIVLDPNNTLTVNADIDSNGDIDVSGLSSLDGGVDINGSNILLNTDGTSSFSGLATVDSLEVTNDAEILGNAFVRGGLFATEFVVNQKRVRFDEVMAVGGGKVSAVSGSAGSETINFEDDDGNLFVPVAVNDILRIQKTTGFSGGTIVKSIYRKVDSVSVNDVILTTTGITWTTGDDVGSIAIGDDVIVYGNTTNANRDHRIEFDISGVDVPRVQVWNGSNDVDAGTIELQWGGLEGWGAQTGIGLAVGDSTLSGNHILLSDSQTSFQLDTFKLESDGLAFDSSVGRKIKVDDAGENIISIGDFDFGAFQESTTSETGTNSTTSTPFTDATAAATSTIVSVGQGSMTSPRSEDGNIADASIDFTGIAGKWARIQFTWSATGVSGTRVPVGYTIAYPNGRIEELSRSISDTTDSGSVDTGYIFFGDSANGRISLTTLAPAGGLTTGEDHQDVIIDNITVTTVDNDYTYTEIGNTGFRSYNSGGRNAIDFTGGSGELTVTSFNVGSWNFAINADGDLEISNGTTVVQTFDNPNL